MFFFVLRAGRRWTCVAFYVVGGAFALAVGVIKYLGMHSCTYLPEVFGHPSSLTILIVQFRTF